MIKIDFIDIERATLPVRSGNEGWIGVSPKGNNYHVVVPVDVQIARGVMAGNRPTDGTPFGGYSGWLYFRCPPYEDDDKDNPALRKASAGDTAKALVKWLADYGVEAKCEPGIRTKEITGNHITVHTVQEGSHDTAPGPLESTLQGRSTETQRSEVPTCADCSKSWQSLGRFLRDPDVGLERYRACLEDFQMGVLIFSHACGGKVEVPVSCFVKSRRSYKSLIGSHACPGLCYHETSLIACAAKCEGAQYRRIAGGLGKRRQRSWGPGL
jgi:hypothetical protein